MNTKIFTLIVILVLFVLIAGNFQVWEDGSFALGSFPYPVSGCLPSGICNLSGMTGGFIPAFPPIR